MIRETPEMRCGEVPRWALVAPRPKRCAADAPVREARREGVARLGDVSPVRCEDSVTRVTDLRRVSHATLRGGMIDLLA